MQTGRVRPSGPAAKTGKDGVMSEQIENPRAATGGMSDVLREQLHRREEVCCKLEALPQSAAEDYPARLEALRTEWNSLPEIPPEYAEILDKRFAEAETRDEGIDDYPAGVMSRPYVLIARIAQADYQFHK